MKQKKKISPGKAIRRDWQLWIMIFPAVLYIAIFCYGPMYGLQLAFRDYDFSKGITGGNWAGFKYFMQYFQSPMFLPTIKNTFVIAFFSILQILLSPSTGILSHALRAVGIVGEKANLLGDPSAFVPVYVISGIWQSAGWNSIIFIAALAAVDGQLYDASKVDGANRWQQVWHVELPAILPTIIILLIMNMGGILSVGFEKTFLMQNALNKSVSEVISTYVYNVGLKSSQFSFGSAVGLFNTIVNFIFLVIANQVSKRSADISLM